MSADRQSYLQQLHRRRNELRAQATRYSGDAPLSLRNQLDDHDRAIALTEQALADDLDEAAWRLAVRRLAVEPPYEPTDETSTAPAATAQQVSATQGSTIRNVAEVGGDVEGGLHLGDTYHYHYGEARPAEPTLDLAAAEAMLAPLYADDLPDPSPLPPGSRMRLPRNPLFVGREADLLRLARIIAGEQTAAIGQIAAATGLGRIGKSQLAVEFVYRYGRCFAGGVFWLSFADGEAVAAEVAACGGSNGMALRPGFDRLPAPEQIALVQAAWREPIPRLLIFDNCEDPALLQRWRPTGGGCRVLLTSRRGTWGRASGVQMHRLGVLSRAESLALLRHHRPDLPPTADPILTDLAAELGDLPLALHLAGSYLESQPDSDPATYLAELRRTPTRLDHASLTGAGLDEDVAYSPTDHDLHVGRTFALSYGRLQPTEPVDHLARQLLAGVACLAPGEPIPRSLLERLARKLKDSEAAADSSLDAALRRLVALGLLEPLPDSAMRLHRLIAFAIQAETDEAGTAARTAAEDAIIDELDARRDKAGYIHPLTDVLPHLSTLADQAQEREDTQSALLLTMAGYCLQQLAAYEAAQPHYEYALIIRERILGPDHPDTASSLNNLGSLLQDRGQLGDARSYYQRALAIRERVLGSVHSDTATSLNNLGSLLQDLGELNEARLYYEQVLTIREQALGPDHPMTAHSLNNLGSLLRALDQLNEARPYYERALTIFERVLGPDHPDTATCLNNLGLLLHKQGQLSEAQPCYQRALAISEQVRGSDHPDTATYLSNLGSLLRALGQLSEARSCHERALNIRERVLGPDHLDTATSLNNLGLLLHDQGQLSEAQPYFERALAIREQVLGPDHPSIHIVRDNLAALLADLEGSA